MGHNPILSRLMQYEFLSEKHQTFCKKPVYFRLHPSFDGQKNRSSNGKFYITVTSYIRSCNL